MRTQFVSVTGTNLIRDINSMGLSLIDQQEKNDYYNKRALMTRQKAEINTLKQEMNDMKTDISEIKTLLKILIEK